MTARASSRHRSVPINVVVERRPPARRAANVVTPVATKPRATVRQKPVWSDTHRRRIMWISVGVGTLVIMIGWISLFSAQIRGNTPTFFGDVSRLVRDVKWPWEPKPATKQEEEIRQLEEQVFPQFQ